MFALNLLLILDAMKTGGGGMGGGIELVGEFRNVLCSSNLM